MTRIVHEEFPACLANLGDLKFPLIICDPPYGGIVNEYWDYQTVNGYLEIAKRCSDVLTDGGSLYLWGGIGKPGNRVFFDFLSKVEGETNLTLANLITWKKRRAYGKKDDYLFTREECAWLVKGKKPAIFNVPYLEEERGYAGFNSKYPAKSKFKRRANVWTDVTEIFRGKLHPTEKPSRLAEIMIEVHTNPGDWVADFFAGSGSTGLAAKKLGRNYFLAEKDLAFYNLIQRRLTDNPEL